MLLAERGQEEMNQAAIPGNIYDRTIKLVYMKALFYSTGDFEKKYLKAAFEGKHEATFTKEHLGLSTVSLAKDYEAICIFTADDGSAGVINELKKNGVRYIAIRATGYDNVDIQAANNAGIRVANVPEYSPYAIAEHAVGIMLALNRKLIKAHEQVHQQNFTLDKLVGFDLNGKKVGIIGTGRIGSAVARILHGFGCTLIAYDVNRYQWLENKYNVFYTGLNTLCSMCDIITIHLPLNDQTKYLVNKKLINQMKKGVMLINTSRGGVLNTIDVLDALRKGQIGYLGIDVYEYEKGLFFNDHSGETITDTLFTQLMDYSNVLITPHQAFATREALTNIAGTTTDNLSKWEKEGVSENEITYERSVLPLSEREIKTLII
jgi:D-lactate dehydrogenase